MNAPRRRLAWLLVVAGFAAIYCCLIKAPAYFAGSYLIGLSLQLGFPLMLRGRSAKRCFWAGFEATGLITLVVFITCRTAFDQIVVRWPMILYEGYRNSLSPPPPAGVDCLLSHIYVFDPRGNLNVLRMITAMEASYGLPMLLLAFIGGLSALLLRRKDINQEGNRDSLVSAAEGTSLLDNRAR
jgi:hypothetical protein